MSEVCDEHVPGCVEEAITEGNNGNAGERRRGSRDTQIKSTEADMSFEDKTHLFLKHWKKENGIRGNSLLFVHLCANYNMYTFVVA